MDGDQTEPLPPTLLQDVRPLIQQHEVHGGAAQRGSRGGGPALPVRNVVARRTHRVHLHLRPRDVEPGEPWGWQRGRDTVALTASCSIQ